MKKNQKKKASGFTLIEVLVVVLILGILSSVALPQYRRSVERTRVAEARTLLRAIFESRERVAWERQYDSYADAKAKGNNFGFNKLDITVKGTYTGTNKTVLETENFSYDMSGDTVIIATAIRGVYSGAKITFTGQSFYCTNGSSGQATKACSVWGSDKWNEL